ncbi:hypothetical protein PRELSG_0733500 [Plasmodium relictum]|uniref:Uncharacterized protein n=1 Tax=Plasmodium relictum TaxID=85471 RepID=A0A1J1H4A1_PLARL|nr:hypothetical protein PRELSG_0733500 [Plasmodium relictum]CRG99570.1 hypothetical protein PRELSG_0733500 [Plasmodium relictum]
MYPEQTEGNSTSSDQNESEVPLPVTDTLDELSELIYIPDNSDHIHVLLEPQILLESNAHSQNSLSNFENSGQGHGSGVFFDSNFMNMAMLVPIVLHLAYRRGNSSSRALRRTQINTHSPELTSDGEEVVEEEEGEGEGEGEDIHIPYNTEESNIGIFDDVSSILGE